MYLYGFREWDFGKSAVVAVLITAFTLLAAIPMMKSAGDEAE
jgi:multiple sugar transport system permease protein